MSGSQDHRDDWCGDIDILGRHWEQLTMLMAVREHLRHRLSLGFFSRTKSHSWHAESKTSLTNRGLRMSLTWSIGTVWGSSLSLSSLSNLCPLSKGHWSIPLYFHGQSPAPAPCHVTPESSPLPHMGKSSLRAKHGIYIFKWLGLGEGTSKEDNFMTRKNYVKCKL